MAHRSAIALLLVFLCSPAGMAAEPAEAQAAAVAQRYIEQLKTGDHAKVVAQFWDLDSLLSGSFGLSYLELSSEERGKTQDAFAAFLAAPYSNPDVSRLFSTLKVRASKTTLLPDDAVAVGLELSGDGGFQSSNTIMLEKRGNNWRIVDQRQGAGPSMRPTVALMWAEESNGFSKSIRSVLENAAAAIRNASAGDGR